MSTTAQTKQHHSMHNNTSRFRINWTLGILTVLSTGVLAGCEYCGPALLATVVGTLVYRFAKPLHEAMQIKSF